MRQFIWLKYFLLTVIAFMFVTCDSADGPTTVIHDDIVISDFTVSPSSLMFTEEEDGIKDTLVTFYITARASHLQDEILRSMLVSSRNNTELDSNTLTPSAEDSERLQGELSVEMKTNKLDNFVIYVYPDVSRHRSVNRVEKTIKVRGIETGQPEILEIRQPETVTIPESGESPLLFFVVAVVSHSVSMDYIAGVHLALFNSEEEEPIYTSTMSDSNETYGTVPGDSIFVQGFTIDSSNSPAAYTIRVHAIDIAETSSDTLRSTLILTR